MQRYRIDAQAELHTIECRLVTVRKSLANTVNKNTVTVRLGEIPGLERKAEALRAEIPMLPERPPLCFSHGDGNFPCLSRTTPLSDTERDELEIPAFLIRLAK